jgi:molybdate transport system regulatory protein
MASTVSPGVTRKNHPPQRGRRGPALTFRVDFGKRGALGPGKVRLLEAIGREGSITSAGKAMGMSYRRAWLLVDDLNAMFAQPPVERKQGGAHGGYARLTAFGRELIDLYRGLEEEATTAVVPRLKALGRAVRK